MLEILPKFSELKTQTLEETLNTLIKSAKTEIEKAIPQKDLGLLQTIEDKQEMINRYFAPISALNAGKSSPELSAVYQHCLTTLSHFGTELLHHRDLFEALASIDENTLNETEKACLAYHLRDFKLEGVNLDQGTQARLKVINERLATLCHQFEENVRLSTEAFCLHIESKEKLSGLPASSLALCAEFAKQQGKPGYCVSLDFPIYYAIMQFADNRELRKTLYDAYSTRASNLSAHKDHDNGSLMIEILNLRQEMARLLGFKDYPEYSLKTKMAKDADEVLSFLTRLCKAVKPKAQEELETLKVFAKKHGLETLEAHDIPYYAEKLKQSRFSFSSEEVRQYFPAQKVVKGVFKTVGRLFALDFQAVEHADCMDESVTLYEVKSLSSETLAFLYVDLYTRQGKRQGAWMAECHNRHVFSDGSLQKPVAFLNCNFNPASNKTPALLTHDDITTLFHELGHCLHHLLTEVNLASVSGINNVAWDAVELPSQFLENWAWDFTVLTELAEHIETGESLPQTLFEKMQAAKHFNNGLFLARQLEFACFDFNLHLQQSIKTEADIQAVLDDARASIAVVKPPETNRFQNSFSHIFAGGYAAAYYSYLWAEALSADAFSLFEESDLFNKTLSQRYRKTILAQGAVKPMSELLKAYLQRETKPEALLKAYGL
ncbi:MAG: oligopeptidase A [Gammaproteobacteria bacterium CG11_big_fil_rev_8_21_14_0_20_46_22]|nr:MAG: oligopeptidase A [Gammaproteobacteria bacterium CG12_big_fil_rev_8_21_14_0_65_46_12]PIR10947.1 MAG: oligopeptidase A [Gammaproteobacteria bacterium CG11_big_fil_rev_8_21_14_0_20_46_22]